MAMSTKAINKLDDLAFNVASAIFGLQATQETIKEKLSEEDIFFLEVKKDSHVAAAMDQFPRRRSDSWIKN